MPAHRPAAWKRPAQNSKKREHGGACQGACTPSRQRYIAGGGTHSGVCCCCSASTNKLCSSRPPGTSPSAPGRPAPPACAPPPALARGCTGRGGRRGEGGCSGKAALTAGSLPHVCMCPHPHEHTHPTHQPTHQPEYAHHLHNVIQLDLSVVVHLSVGSWAAAVSGKLVR